jgi:hypothetical protein
MSDMEYSGSATTEQGEGKKGSVVVKVAMVNELTKYS